jgi:hypothetical protein
VILLRQILDIIQVMFGGVFGNSTKSEEPTVEDRPKMSFALCREDSLYVLFLCPPVSNVGRKQVYRTTSVQA